MQNVVVYCGASFGSDPKYAALAGRVGEMIARLPGRLVYGGGSVGLMGTLADACMAAGGEVVGVIPEIFITKEQAHHGLPRLEVVPDMHTRKHRMMTLGDAFVMLPGGIGTMEEFSDTVSHFNIYHTDRKPPVIVLDPDSFYAPLRAMFATWFESGFAVRSEWKNLSFVSDLKEAEEILRKNEFHSPLRNALETEK